MTYGERDKMMILNEHNRLDRKLIKVLSSIDQHLKHLDSAAKEPSNDNDLIDEKHLARVFRGSDVYGKADILRWCIEARKPRTITDIYFDSLLKPLTVTNSTQYNASKAKEAFDKNDNKTALKYLDKI